MMDKLLEQLLQEVDELLKLGDISFSKISPSGEKSKQLGSLKRQQNYWQQILDTVDNRRNRLISFLNEDKSKLERNTQLDQRLAFFREMSRRISESPPEWSAYYPDIEKLQSTIAIKLDEIDEKYQLGWEHPDYK